MSPDQTYLITPDGFGTTFVDGSSGVDAKQTYSSVTLLSPYVSWPAGLQTKGD